MKRMPFMLVSFRSYESKSEKDKLYRMQDYELEYAEESQSTDDSNGNGGTTGNAVKHSAKVKPEWEDTITNRMLHWSYTPDISVEQMRSYRDK